MEKNIVLIGFMGTGKTAVGTRLATRLGREFIDTDKEIERITGMSVKDIFHKAGEIRFRSEEALVIKRLTQKNNLVIATGGGAVLNGENIANLREQGVLVCLNADPEDIFRRVSRRKQTRPLLNKKDLSVDDIRKMLEDRAEYYNKADIQITTSGMEPEQIVQEIISRLREEDDE